MYVYIHTIQGADGYTTFPRATPPLPPGGVVMSSFTHRGQTFSNRVGLSPLTRGRASPDGLVNDLHVQYYTERATGGFVITEATAIAKRAHGWFRSPGIWTTKQVCKRQPAMYPHDFAFLFEFLSYTCITSHIKSCMQRKHCARLIHAILTLHAPVSNSVIHTVQMESWKAVTASVHKVGGNIYCQV